MEERNNMTAERSLEIITEQIELSRQVVAKDTGQTLFVSGLCTMGMALLVGILIYFTDNLAWHLLYVLLPVVILAADRYTKRNRAKVPVSFVGTMVDKTWQTFGIFVLSFFVFAIIYNSLMARTEALDVYARLMIHPFRIVLLLMGMAITINGYTLKSRWMVWCGIVGGIGGYIWESFYVSQTIAGRFFTISEYSGIANGLIPAIMIAILAFIGLTLPGMKLKQR
ncbi:MAG: hypothetical protein IJ637_05160 [Prevotella sp.]|nr:hypothetical protein [Prevotella sp.]